MTTTTLSTRVRRNRLPHRVRQSVLTVHIIAAVGLLGDSAGFLAVAIRATTTDDSADAASSYEVLRMFSYLFGIPLSLIALATGLALGLGTRWGVFRSPWVTGKLALLLSVLAVGGLAIDPALESLRDARAGSEGTLIAAAAWQVTALVVATALSVFKPGGRRWPWRRGRAGDPVGGRPPDPPEATPHRRNS